MLEPTALVMSVVNQHRQELIRNFNIIILIQRIKNVKFHLWYNSVIQKNLLN